MSSDSKGVTSVWGLVYGLVENNQIIYIKLVMNKMFVSLYCFLDLDYIRAF